MHAALDAPALERLVVIAALLAYGYVTFVHLLPGVVGPKAVRRARIVASVGAVLNVAAIVLAVVGGARPGFALALAAASVGLALGYLWMGARSKPALGMILAPLALVTLGTSQVIPDGRVQALAETGVSAWLPVHLGLMFSGLMGFVFAFAVGILYLVARARLKAKDFTALGRLPSLEVLDRFQFRSMLFGFVFLTLGIGVGGAWAALSLDRPWGLDPKVWLTLVIWLWYGIALQVRLVAGWRGRWSALFSIVGFLGLLLSLLATNFLLQSWHGYAD